MFRCNSDCLLGGALLSLSWFDQRLSRSHNSLTAFSTATRTVD